MTSRRRSTLGPGATFALALLATFAGAASLQAQDRWQVRVHAAYGSAGSGWDLRDDDEFIEINTDQVSGWGAAIDYRFSPRLSLELGYLDTDVDTDVVLSISGIGATDSFDIGFSPFLLGLGIDLLSSPKIDLVVTPRLAWIDYGNPQLSLPEIDTVGELTLDDEISWGLGLRLDIPLGSFLVSAGVDYYDATAEVTNQDVDQDIRIAVDPWVGTVGIGYRF